MDEEQDQIEEVKLLFKYRAAAGLLERFLYWVVLHAVHRRIIWSIDGERPYLLRTHIVSRSWWPSFLPRPYLHLFFRGDEDRAHHNHPWEDSRSLILVNGYSEERVDTRTGVLSTKTYGPLSWVRIRRNDFHKVTLLNGEWTWTLFFAGRRVDTPEQLSWGFFDQLTMRYAPWLDYVKSRRKEISNDAVRG